MAFSAVPARSSSQEAAPRAIFHIFLGLSVSRLISHLHLPCTNNYFSIEYHTITTTTSGGTPPTTCIQATNLVISVVSDTFFFGISPGRHSKLVQQTDKHAYQGGHHFILAQLLLTPSTCLVLFLFTNLFYFHSSSSPLPLLFLFCHLVPDLSSAAIH